MCAGSWPVVIDGVGIEAQLQNVTRLGGHPCQLRIDGLRKPKPPPGSSTRSRKSATPRIPLWTKGIW